MFIIEENDTFDFFCRIVKVKLNSRYGPKTVAISY